MERRAVMSASTRPPWTITASTRICPRMSAPSPMTSSSPPWISPSKLPSMRTRPAKEIVPRKLVPAPKSAWSSVGARGKPPRREADPALLRPSAGPRSVPGGTPGPGAAPPSAWKSEPWAGRRLGGGRPGPGAAWPSAWSSELGPGVRFDGGRGGAIVAQSYSGGPRFPGGASSLQLGALLCWMLANDASIGDDPLANPLGSDLGRPRGQGRKPGRGELIVVADDDRVTRTMLERVLTANGYRVETVADGQAAVVRAAGGDVDLLLLDHVMPRMSGLEACRLIKAGAGDNFLPVVLITIKTDTASRVEGLRIGADDYVCKPFDEGELLARIEAMLRIKHLHDHVARARAKLERLSVHDELTGLYNYRYLNTRLAEEF